MKKILDRITAVSYTHLDVYKRQIETMGDSYELKAAVLAAKEVSSLPVFRCV